jgi:hypothetical protein
VPSTCQQTGPALLGGAAVATGLGCLSLLHHLLALALQGVLAGQNLQASLKEFMWVEFRIAKGGRPRLLPVGGTACCLWLVWQRRCCHRRLQPWSLQDNLEASVV